jgi:hypothetical protein
VPPLQTSSADVGWTIEAPCLLRRRLPSLGTSACTSSTPTPSKAESADWRRRRKRPTRPARAGEGWDRVHYVPARPRPLGEHGDESHGLRFARPFRPSRIATELHGREADISICVYCRRIYLESIRVFLRSIGPILNIQRASLIFLRTDLEIFTPLHSDFTMA